MAKIDPYETNVNKQLALLVEEIDEIITDLNESQSTDRTAKDLHDADMNRVRNQDIPYLRERLGYLQKQNELDRPNTSSNLIPIPQPPKVPDCENTLLREVVSELVDMRTELVESGLSGRQRLGIESHDYGRAIETLDNLQENLLPFIDEKTPVDLPDTQPDKPQKTLEPEYGESESA